MSWINTDLMLAFHSQISYKFGAIGASTPITPNQNESDFIMAPESIKQLPNNINIPEGAIAIPLSQNHYTLIDAEDYEKVSRYNWHLYNAGGHKYAITNIRLGINKRATIKLHRYILDFPNQLIDHANGDGLDNRRCNLRACSPTQNCMNRKPKGKLNTKGISFKKGHWIARIQYQGERTILGYFQSKEIAQQAYNMAAESIANGFGRGAPLDASLAEQLEQEVSAYQQARQAPGKCMFCGDAFIKRKARHKYCSYQCKEKARPPRPYSPRKLKAPHKPPVKPSADFQ